MVSEWFNWAQHTTCGTVSIGHFLSILVSIIQLHSYVFPSICSALVMLNVESTSDFNHVLRPTQFPATATFISSQSCVAQEATTTDWFVYFLLCQVVFAWLSVIFRCSSLLPWHLKKKQWRTNVLDSSSSSYSHHLGNIADWLWRSPHNTHQAQKENIDIQSIFNKKEVKCGCEDLDDVADTRLADTDCLALEVATRRDPTKTRHWKSIYLIPKHPTSFAILAEVIKTILPCLGWAIGRLVCESHNFFLWLWRS